METVTAAALQMRGIRKAFGETIAIDGVDLDVFPGEIHALVGENGAGKSTLASIAFGKVRADEGTVEARGNVGLVHQHFELIGRLRVWENVMLGAEPRSGWRIDAHAARERVRAVAAANAVEIDPDRIVDELPVAAQQRVELLRELQREPAVLLLDEPTAALAPAEIRGFFETVQRLAAAGAAVLVITHKLQEVAGYSHRISVMRHGRIVARMQTAATTIDEIARAMVGGELPQIAQRADTALKPCVSLRDVSARTEHEAISGITFDVRAGEIVGLAGVEGNGQTVLADVLAGLLPYSGSIELPRRRAVVPQDRRSEALVLRWPITENVMLGRTGAFQNRGVLNRPAARAEAEAIVRKFDVRAASADTPVRALSGGNQQKLVVGRALADDPEFLVAYQPTRGVDVGAAALVQSKLVEARNAGAAILLISFELDEILAIADRVLVFYRGRIAGECSGAAMERGAIGRLMTGAA